MSLIQIFILAFAAFAITRVVKQFREGALTIAFLIFWIIFWVAAGLATALPQTTDVIAKFAGVGRGADFIIYISLVALFFLVFKVYTKIENVEKEITKLVRKTALDELEKDL